MINLQFSGMDCYLLHGMLEEVIINMDDEDIFEKEKLDIYIEFYMQWLSQDFNLHEMLLRR